METSINSVSKNQAPAEPYLGLADVIADVIALINMINNGSLSVYARMATNAAEANAAYTKTETDVLKKDSNKISSDTVDTTQFTVDSQKYTTDQSTFQGYLATTQTAASNASDEVSNLTKAFQTLYQNISTVLQISQNLSRILG